MWLVLKFEQKKWDFPRYFAKIAFFFVEKNESAFFVFDL